MIFSNFPFFSKLWIFDKRLHVWSDVGQTLLKNGLTLVQIAIPSVGPPIVIPIGAVLDDGSVYLNDGMEVEGAFWESTDRRLYENGTIVYKLTETQELGKVTYALLEENGNLDYLPMLGDTPTSMNLFRRLNSKPASKSLYIHLGDLDINDEDWSGIRDSASSAILDRNRRKRSIKVDDEVSKQGILRQALSLADLVNRVQVSTGKDILDSDILCYAIQRIHDEETKSAVLFFKPQYTCFYDNIIRFCSEKTR